MVVLLKEPLSNAVRGKKETRDPFKRKVIRNTFPPPSRVSEQTSRYHQVRATETNKLVSVTGNIEMRGHRYPEPLERCRAQPKLHPGIQLPSLPCHRLSSPIGVNGHHAEESGVSSLATKI